jgi:hypothetical protein
VNEVQKKFLDPNFKEAVIEELCERLADGTSLVAACKADDMPSVRSVQTWMVDDEKLAAQIMRAREAGFLIMAERAVENAKSADDAPLGRLAFDADRWYLGKLSNAFSDDKARKHELTGKDGRPIETIDLTKLTPDQLSALEGIGAITP